MKNVSLSRSLLKKCTLVQHFVNCDSLVFQTGADEGGLQIDLSSELVSLTWHDFFIFEFTFHFTGGGSQI